MTAQLPSTFRPHHLYRPQYVYTHICVCVRMYVLLGWVPHNKIRMANHTSMYKPASAWQRLQTRQCQRCQCEVEVWVAVSEPLCKPTGGVQPRKLQVILQIYIGGAPLSETEMAHTTTWRHVRISFRFKLPTECQSLMCRNRTAVPANTDANLSLGVNGTAAAR